ncbi:MAG: globin [Helicobacteraceae bacterium]|jgi:hemoglobin|nr:globin [Helicobacteraceae bacterium]
MSVVKFSAINPHEAGCACTGGGKTGRVIPASRDFDYPTVFFPDGELLKKIGAEALRKLVFRHHSLLRESEIGNMFPKDEEEFLRRVSAIADFIVEACGGERNYSEREGRDVCIRTRHFPIEITEKGREVWLRTLYTALEESGFPRKFRAMYWEWLEPFSIRMINRRTTKTQPVRMTWKNAKAFADGKLKVKKAAETCKCGCH